MQKQLQMCMHLFIFSPFFTQKEVHYTACSIPSARCRGGLCYLCGQVLCWGARAGEMGTGLHCAVAGTWRQDQKWNPVLLTFHPESFPLHGPVSWISFLPMQVSTTEVLAGFSEAVCPLKWFKISPGNLSHTTHSLSKPFPHRSCKGKL